MSLPKLETPKFELTLPSTKKKYKFRPFIAKEEKVLLIALEGGDEQEVINTVKNIIEVCVEGIDVEKLPMFDLEYIFLKLREKSIGDKIKFSVKHPEGECNHVQNVEIDLSEIEVSFDENHTNKIQLNSSTGVVMRYPTLELAGEISNVNENDPDAVFDIIKKSIEYVYDTDTVYNNFTPSELSDFVESMSHSQLEKITNFFTTMPKLRHEIKWKCDVCGKEETVVLEGLANFFT